MHNEVTRPKGSMGVLVTLKSNSGRPVVIEVGEMVKLQDLGPI